MSDRNDLEERRRNKLKVIRFDKNDKTLVESEKPKETLADVGGSPCSSLKSSKPTVKKPAEACCYMDRRAAEKRSWHGPWPHVFLHLGWVAGERADYGKQTEFMKNAVRLEPESKQIRLEDLESLQRNYLLYRMFLYPIKLIRKLKPWQIKVSWIVLFLLFGPIIFKLKTRLSLRS